MDRPFPEHLERSGVMVFARLWHRVAFLWVWAAAAPWFAAVALGQEKPPLRFQGPPQVNVPGQKVQIAFGVTAAADVAVSIRRDVQVARHLAAGALGGNPIVRFGDYGNMDSQVPGGAVPEPAIAFAWPQHVAVSDEAAYVSDIVKQRDRPGWAGLLR